MQQRLQLDAARKRRRQDPGHHPLGRFERTPGPTVLLSSVGCHRDGQLSWGRALSQIERTPALELDAIAQVQIFGECGCAPTTGLLDRVPPPYPRGAIEIQEEATVIPRELFHREVTINSQGLEVSEERVLVVQVVPAGLDEAHLGIAEVGNRPQQEIGLRHEIGIEDRNKLPGGYLQPPGERPCFVAFAAIPADVHHVYPALSVSVDGRSCDPHRLVCGVIQHLDFQPVAGPLERGRGVDQTFGHVPFVVDRQLHRDVRMLQQRWGRRFSIAMHACLVG